MFRMHSRRIGPGTLVVLAPLSLAALAAIAAFEVASFDPVGPAFAQTPSPVTQTPSPVTLSGLFDPESADLKTTQQLKNAINNPPRKCYPPRVKFTVVVPGSGDKLFDETLAGARQEQLQNALPSLGLERGQFKVDYVIGVVDEVLVSYGKFTPEDDKDREAPKLKVTSEPENGSLVQDGQKIIVTITASERYEDGHKSWPTGVQNIQLVADDGLVDSKDYGRPTQPCVPRTIVATYTVPPKPPPIVHLRVIAEDGVGNRDDKTVLEFSTGTPASDCLSRFGRVIEWAGEVTITLEARWLAPDGIERASADFTATAPFALRLKPPPPNRKDITYNWDGSGKVSLRYRAEYWRRRDLGPFPVQVWKEATTKIALERIDGNAIPLKEVWIFMIHPLHPSNNPLDGPCTYRFVVHTESFDIDQVIHDPDNLFGSQVSASEARVNGVLGVYLFANPIPVSSMVLKGSRKLALGPQGSSWISTFTFHGGHPEGVLTSELPGFKEPALATVNWTLTPSKFR